MSYEGYTQGLCLNGHQTPNFPSSYDLEGEQRKMREWRCPAHTNNILCNAPIGETNSVDDTNCDNYGIRLLIQISPEEKRTCNFGHEHVWTAARFRFSEEKYYYDSESGQMLSLTGEK